MQQLLQAFVLEFLEICVKVLPAVFDPVKPGLSVLLCAFDVVDLAVVVSVDAVLQVAGEARFGMLVFPQIAQLFQVHFRFINQRLRFSYKLHLDKEFIFHSANNTTQHYEFISIYIAYCQVHTNYQSLQDLQ